MFKKMLYRKIMVASSLLGVIMLLYLIPVNDVPLKQDVDYVYTNNKAVIYLLDDNDYVSRTVIPVNGKDTLTILNDLMDGLTKDGKKKDIIPNGFKSLLPINTKIIDMNLKDGVLRINFSKEFNNVSIYMEEKLIEALVYTTTSIDGISKLDLYVDGKKLTNYPNSRKKLPDLLDKSFGINKKYYMTSLNSVDAFTVYYVGNIDSYSYYIPVTKYVSSSNGQDKVKVIIDELTSSIIHESNLASYLDTKAKLLDYEILDEKIKLNFNDKILSNITENNILEEVMYSVGLSLCDEYDVKEVIFMVNNVEVGVFKGE